MKCKQHYMPSKHLQHHFQLVTDLQDSVFNSQELYDAVCEVGS